MNHLPAGLINNQYEFFANTELHAFCLTQGRVIPFEEFDESLLSLVEAEMMKFPVKIFNIHKMGFTGRVEVIRQFLLCNYGGFDNSADMADSKLQPTEYWPCPLRGKCAFEGKICDGLKTDSGQILSTREIQVVKLIASGHMDKEIASHLKIKLNTVTTHTKNIRTKTGLFRKPDITRFAYQNQLI
ncbi:response regulator transcription factor [Mucilaginibacter sp.]